MEELNRRIQNLPKEISEKIYKYYVTTKLTRKEDQGWQEVNKQILSALYCNKCKQIVKVTVCRKCDYCGRSDLCFPCFKKSFINFLFFDINDCDEIFLKYI